MLLISFVNNFSITVWREVNGHGVNYAGRRSVDDAEAWLPGNHKLLAPYSKARVVEWAIDEQKQSESDKARAKAMERIEVAEAELKAAREKLKLVTE